MTKSDLQNKTLLHIGQAHERRSSISIRILPLHAHSYHSMTSLRLPTGKAFPQVHLVEPLASRFIVLTAVVDRRPLFLPASRRKSALLTECKQHCAQLLKIPGVKSANVFRAVLTPPGRGAYLKRRPDLHVPRLDVAVLLEFDLVARDKLLANSDYLALVGQLSASRSYREIEATNARRIDSVDHSRDGVFLFNYFVAADREKNLAVWNHTAGWFESETGLDNSTVLVPVARDSSPYSIINHCRWDRWTDILPSLIFKRSFSQFVLKSFDLNDVAAVPVLYRLA